MKKLMLPFRALFRTHYSDGILTIAYSLMTSATSHWQHWPPPWSHRTISRFKLGL